MNAALSTIENNSRAEKSMIEMIDVHKWFGDYHVLKGIHLSDRKQERIVICGPSGSGKSTLIRCINRLEEHQHGRIVVDGIELADNIKYIEKIRAEVGRVSVINAAFRLRYRGSRFLPRSTADRSKRHILSLRRHSFSAQMAG